MGYKKWGISQNFDLNIFENSSPDLGKKVLCLEIR